MRKAKKKQLIKDDLIQKAEIKKLEAEEMEETSTTLDMQGGLETITEEPAIFGSKGTSDTKPERKKPKYNIPNLSKIEKDIHGVLNLEIKGQKDPSDQNDIQTRQKVIQILLDPTDQQFTNEGSLKPIGRSGLRKDEILNWRYGQYVADNVVERLGFPQESSSRLTIKISETLPDNNYTNNAFRRSFYHDSSSNTLWIRQARLLNISDLQVIICHCLSHICLNNKNLTPEDRFDDSNDDFLANLYLSLKAMNDIGLDNFENLVLPVSLRKGHDSGGDSVLEEVIDKKLERLF